MPSLMKTQSELLYSKDIREISKEIKKNKGMDFEVDRHSVFLYDKKKAVIKDYQEEH